LLSFRGFDTPSLPAQGEQRRFSYFNIDRDISKVTSGGGFVCKYCRAEYLVSYRPLPIADSGSAYCDVCRRHMIQWNSSQEPSYKLVKRPDHK
jgi:hypothetical protein